MLWYPLSSMSRAAASISAVILLEHGIPFPPMAAAMEEGWSDSQRRLVHLSTNSELLTAHGSGHLIYMDAPGLVIESVRRVHAAARDGTQLTRLDSQPSAA
jgi:hypothetical protein